ncbi:MAG TPA: DUF5999 family protein, partial [Streptosporangiaceae bacterium]
GWSLLCNGVTLFDGGGELLPDGRVVSPARPSLARVVAMAAGGQRREKAQWR